MYVPADSTVIPAGRCPARRCPAWAVPLAPGTAHRLDRPTRPALPVPHLQRTVRTAVLPGRYAPPADHYLHTIPADRTTVLAEYRPQPRLQGPLPDRRPAWVLPAPRVRGPRSARPPWPDAADVALRPHRPAGPGPCPRLRTPQPLAAQAAWLPRAWYVPSVKSAYRPGRFPHPMCVSHRPEPLSWPSAPPARVRVSPAAPWGRSGRCPHPTNAFGLAALCCAA
jgi:hypothetical protein